MAEKFKNLLTTIDDYHIALLTINRPDKLNALNNEVLDELEQAFSAFRKDDNVKAVIVTGAGDKAFVAGADIQELSNLNKKTGKKTSQKGQKIFSDIEMFPKPVIAVVNGYALGGGAELAMACHLRIATGNAVFSLPEVSLGLIPGYGGTQRLPALIGRGNAMELILTGRQMKAEEAKSVGLVNKVVVDDDAVTEARKMLISILKKGPIALAHAIKAVNSSIPDNRFENEADLFAELCDTSDFQEGTTAFLEKRKPDFTGS
jgi:enoyl-CoA hydratase